MTQTILTIILAIFGSTGFWALVTQIISSRSASNQMLMGLCYERLVTKCKNYIHQGYIPIDEFEDLHKYLYDPYKKMGGNGTAEVLMNKVYHLPRKPDMQNTT